MTDTPPEDQTTDRRSKEFQGNNVTLKLEESAGVQLPEDDCTPEVDAESDTAATVSDEESQPGAEAARYRRRLRDAEKERDALAVRVEALQRQQVEALLARERMTPKALWATTELADVVGDDGLVDPVKVKQAAQAARDELGITSGLYVPAEGKIPPPPTGDRFTAAFKPKHQ